MGSRFLLGFMRGTDDPQGSLFRYVNPESRIPATHPARKIRSRVDEVLAELDRDSGSMYARTGRPSIRPENLPRALVVQILYSARSERLLMEQLNCNLLFRWFVGLGGG